MRRRRSKLRRDWWVSSAVFLAAAVLAWLVWWMPSYRTQAPLEVRFVGGPAGEEP